MDPTLLPCYKYEPIDSISGEIRLVDVLPGTGEDPIQCCIRHVNMTASVSTGDDRWQALSYAWGDLNDTKSIQIDGHSLLVTVNLFAALRDLRLPLHMRTLWIDAICINQRDISERGQAILNMQFIYMKAKKVLAYLGEEVPGVSVFFDLAGMSSNHPPRYTYLGEAMYQRLKDILPEREAASYGKPNPKSSKKAVELWNGLLGLMKSSWSHRLWIVQEASLAENLDLCMGRYSVSWEDFYKTASTLWYGYGEPEAALARSSFGDISLIRSKFHDARDRRVPLDAIELCRITRQRTMTDPRDGIYGIMGIADFNISPANHSSLFRADYTKLLLDVYSDFVRLMINKHQDLRVLTLKWGLSLSEPKFGKLPSWCPFVIYDTMPDLMAVQIDPSDQEPRFGASHDLIAFTDEYSESFTTSKRLRAQLRSGPQAALTLYGVIFDTVYDIATYNDEIDADHHSKLRIRPEWLTFASTNIKASAVYNHTEQGAEILLRTLSADHSYKTRLRQYPLKIDSRVVAQDTSVEDLDKYSSSMNIMNLVFTNSILRNRTLFSTERGYLGLGSRYTLPGDKIAILHGGAMPVLLRGRPSAGGTQIGGATINSGDLENVSDYILVGSGFCYVHGIMDGEAIDIAEAEGIPNQWIDLY